ncbi:hypothetical protein [Roseovarius ramblicola]|uniref:Uncharacterized protein n=1 Tax=Roseovarius ramblicola TaxID=2022336 RepID=A0ABV5I4M8_9RHOB
MRFLLAISIWLFPVTVNAQDNELPGALDNPYVTAALEITDLIETGDIQINKDDAVAEIQRRLDASQGDFGNLEKALTPSFLSLSEINEVSDQLPPLEELPPVSMGVRLLIAGSVLDQVSELQELGVEPNVEGMLPILGPSLYITLASAALEVNAENPEPTIDVVAVRRGGIRFFSLGWPFCCSHDLR